MNILAGKQTNLLSEWLADELADGLRATREDRE